MSSSGRALNDGGRGDNSTGLSAFALIGLVCVVALASLLVVKYVNERGSDQAPPPQPLAGAVPLSANSQVEQAPSAAEVAAKQRARKRAAERLRARRARAAARKRARARARARARRSAAEAPAPAVTAEPQRQAPSQNTAPAQPAPQPQPAPKQTTPKSDSGDEFDL